MRTLTSKQLYEMIWQRPLDVVAAELGVSGTAVRKKCKRLGIPTPPRGFWARKRVGVTGAVPRFEFPSQSSRLVFVEARMRDIADLSELNRASRKPRASRAKPTAKIAAIESWHPVTAKIARGLRPHSKEDAPGAVGGKPFGIAVGRNSIRKALVALDAIARETAMRGGQIATGRGSVVLAFDGATVALELSEAVDSYIDSDAVARWEKRCSDIAVSLGWAPPPHPPRPKKTFTGKLSWHIVEQPRGGLRTAWSEDDRRSLPELVPAVMAGVQNFIWAKRRVAAERRLEEQRGVVAHAEASLKAREAQREKFAADLAEMMQRSSQLRRLARSLSATAPGSRLRSWATEKAEAERVLVARRITDSELPNGLFPQEDALKAETAAAREKLNAIEAELHVLQEDRPFHDPKKSLRAACKPRTQEKRGYPRGLIGP
jgi:hypothetical protein